MFRDYSDPEEYIFGSRFALKQHTLTFLHDYVTTAGDCSTGIGISFLFPSTTHSLPDFFSTRPVVVIKLLDESSGPAVPGVGYNAWLKCSPTLLDCCW